MCLCGGLFFFFTYKTRMRSYIVAKIKSVFLASPGKKCFEPRLKVFLIKQFCYTIPLPYFNVDIVCYPARALMHLHTCIILRHISNIRGLKGGTGMLIYTILDLNLNLFFLYRTLFIINSLINCSWTQFLV
jgi:hypothetical protein